MGDALLRSIEAVQYCVASNLHGGRHYCRAASSFDIICCQSKVRCEGLTVTDKARI